MPLLTKGAGDMTFGVDYSSGRPSHTALKTAGAKFVVRYIGSSDHTKTRHPKFLTPAEAKALHDDGFDIGVVFEQGAQRADGGRTAGLTDAHLAISELAWCGLPASMAVYFAVDYDAVAGPLISGYFGAIGEVLSVPRTGGYGGFRVVKALRDKGLIGKSWQTYAWSWNSAEQKTDWDSRNDLEQYANNKAVGGASVDYDRAMKPDFGQWPAKTVPPPVPKPPPAPKPWPGRYLKYTPGNPLMHGSDVTWTQQHLNTHGAKLKVDSEYGAKSRDAVKTFQKAKHLTVDGVVGKATWTALGK